MAFVDEQRHVTAMLAQALGARAGIPAGHHPGARPAMASWRAIPVWGQAVPFLFADLNSPPSL
jgi:hypothetical protein